MWSIIEFFGISILGFFIMLKIYCKFTIGFYNGKERLDGRTVIVTGASSGIGLECAKELARRGARVLMLCRDMEKGNIIRNDIVNRTGNKHVLLKHIDFASLSSVRKCASEILGEEPHIDILLNNAGTCALGLQNMTVDGLEQVLQTNHFGPFLFTNILLGRIKESSPSRIVNVSSVMHSFAELDLDRLDQRHITSETVLYANSKLANIYFTVVLADKLRGSGVTVNCLHPGVVRSNIVRNTQKYFQFIWDTTMKLLFKTPWEGAQTSIFLCVSSHVEKVTGKYFSDCKERSTSKDARDPIRAAKLWELSEEAVQLQPCEKHY